MVFQEELMTFWQDAIPWHIVIPVLVLICLAILVLKDFCLLQSRWDKAAYLFVALVIAAAFYAICPNACMKAFLLAKETLREWTQ